MPKTWLITGCSSGLGMGIAKAALHRGDHVAMTAQNLEGLQGLAQEYPGQAVQDTLQTFGAIDVLVNNAGHGYRAAIEESEPEAIRGLFETNFFSPMELVKMVLPQMRARSNGLIINVSSIDAVRGALGNGYYSAAKGALELASEALAKEVKHLGIHVMLVEPGAFRTGFYGQRLQGSSLEISDYDALASQYRKESTGNFHNQKGDPEKAGKQTVGFCRVLT